MIGLRIRNCFFFQERLKFEEKRLDDQLRKLDHEAVEKAGMER